jgi:voltage-gated potassium channel
MTRIAPSRRVPAISFRSAAAAEKDTRGNGMAGPGIGRGGKGKRGSAREIRLASTLFVVLFLAGTLGFRVIENLSWLDALYMTVITLSTVGFGEVHPLSPAGKAFTIGLILLGVGTLGFLASRATEAALGGTVFRRRRMLMENKRLTSHVIVCGFGRMGKSVTDQLDLFGTPFTVVEKDPARLEELEDRGLPHVPGDATDDATLLAAGVERARALATVLPHDADNLFVTLTARSLNRDLTIVARASTDKNHSKLLSAGANRIFDPYQSGGRLLARQLLQPSVIEFMEVLDRGGAGDLAMEEVQIAAGSPLAGVTLRDAPIRREMDVIVVGVRRADQELVFNPAPDLAPRAGDVLVALGRRDNLQRLARLAEGS